MSGICEGHQGFKPFVRLSKLLVSRNGHRQFGTPHRFPHVFAFLFYRASLLHILYVQIRACLVLQWTHCSNYPSQKEPITIICFLDPKPTCATKLNWSPLDVFFIHDQHTHLQGAAAGCCYRVLPQGVVEYAAEGRCCTELLQAETQSCAGSAAGW